MHSIVSWHTLLKTYNHYLCATIFFPQIIEIKGDAVLIKQERVGENKYGTLFKGERICTQDQSE